MKFKYTVIILFLISCTHNETVYNSNYFVDLYKNYDSSAIYSSDSNAVSITILFIEPFYFKTTFFYKDNLHNIRGIINEIDSDRYGEQIYFFDSLDRVEKYKFYCNSQCHSYAVYFDKKGEIVNTEGNCMVDFIPTKDSLKVYGIDLFCSIFSFDKINVQCKISDDKDFHQLKMIKSNFSPFILTTYIDVSKVRPQEKIYLKYVLQRDNQKIVQNDTLVNNGVDIVRTL